MSRSSCRQQILFYTLYILWQPWSAQGNLLEYEPPLQYCNGMTAPWSAADTWGPDFRQPGELLSWANTAAGDSRTALVHTWGLLEKILHSYTGGCLELPKCLSFTQQRMHGMATATYFYVCVCTLQEQSKLCFMVVPFTGSLESCFNLKEHETLLLFLWT